jgi:MFS family permease
MSRAVSAPARTGYLALLRLPGAARLAGAALIGRLPIGMQALAVIILVEESTGSYGTAGGVAAAFAVASGVFSPVQGRAVDRIGQTPVLLVSVFVYAAGLVALVVAAGAEASPVVLAACGVVAGAALPPLSACMRTLWPILAGRERVEAAYALETVLQEGFYISGPLLVGLLVVVASPAAAVLAMAALAVAGTVAFATARAAREQRGGRTAAGRAGAMGAAGIRVLVAATIPMGLAFGMLEVAVPAFADAHGSEAQAGILLGVWGVGSMTAGLWYGTRRWRLPPERRYLPATIAFALGFLPLALADSIPVMAVLLAVAGLGIAPTFSTAYTLVDRLAPLGTAAEAFTLTTTAVVVGVAAGNAIAGALVEGSGTTATFLAAAGAACLSVLAAALGRAALRPA